MKGFLVRLDWEAIGPPSIETALEEFDSRESHGDSSMQDGSAGFITRAGAVNHQVSLFREQRRILAPHVGREPLCARDDDRVSQQVQRLPNINNKYFLA